MRPTKLSKIKNLEQLTKHRIAAEEKTKSLTAELSDLKASASEAAALGEDVGKILDRRSKVEMELEAVNDARDILIAKHLELVRAEKIKAAEEYTASIMKAFDEKVIADLRAQVEEIAQDEQARRIRAASGQHAPTEHRHEDRAGRLPLVDELYRMAERAIRPAKAPAQPVADNRPPQPIAGENITGRIFHNRLAEMQGPQESSPQFTDDPAMGPDR